MPGIVVMGHTQNLVHGPGEDLFEPVAAGGADICAGGPEEQLVFAFGRFPGRCGLVEGGQAVVVHRHGKHLAFAGLQESRFGKGLELAGGFLQAAGGGAHVELHHFLTGYFARIGDGDGSGETIGPGLHGGFGIREAGIAEAIAEGIGDLHFLRHIVTVAHPDVFRVLGKVHVLFLVVGGQRLVVVGEIGLGGDVPVIVGEAHGQFSGGVHLAREDVCKGIGAFLARRPGQEDGIREVLPGGGFNDPANIQDHHYAFSPGPIGIVKVLKKLLLGGGKLEVSRQLSVLAFAGLAAQHHHRHVVHRCLVINGRRREEGLFAVLVVLLKLHLETVLKGFGFQRIVVLEAAVQHEAALLQGLGHGNHIGFVHLAGAGSAGNEILAGDAVQGHPLVALEGQGVPLVAKKDDGFCRRLARSHGVGFQVRMAGVGIVAEFGCLYHIFQDAAHVAVHLFHGKTAVLHAFQDAPDFHVGAGVHEVVSGLDGFCGVVFEAPVCDHDAFVAPLVAEDGGEQLVILLGIFSVELVVGAHDGPGTAFLHGKLEVSQVNLPEGAAAHQGVVLRAVGLLVIGRIVLGRCAHSVTLDAPDVGGGHFATQERVFGEILEVTATERVSVDVHTGCQQHVHAIFQHFVSHHLHGLFHQLGVPGTGQEGAHGEARGHGVGGVPLRVYTHTGRAVGEDGLGNA